MPGTPIGIDISDRILRLVQLDQHGESYKVHAYHSIDLPEGLIVSGVIQDPEKVGAHLSALVRDANGNRVRGHAVVSVLPERQSFIKLIQLASVPEDRVRSEIEGTLPQHFPLTADEVYFDTQVVPGVHDGSTVVLVAASPKTLVDQYVRAFQAAKLELTSLELESAAICRAVLPHSIPADAATLVVDIGLNRASYIMVDYSVIAYTYSSNAVSGHGMTDALTAPLKLTYTKAEKAKRLCGLDPARGKGEVRRVLLPMVKTLEKEIRTVLSFYAEHFPFGHHVTSLQLTGGAANLHLLPEMLSQSLKLVVQRANPLAALVARSIPAELASTAASYTTALGLALHPTPR